MYAKRMQHLRMYAKYLLLIGRFCVFTCPVIDLVLGWNIVPDGVLCRVGVEKPDSWCPMDVVPVT